MVLRAACALSHPRFGTDARFVEMMASQAQAIEKELIRLQADNEREHAQAMYEASSLAMSLFQKHYSSDPDYASGAVKFGLCDDLRGVISQIDNMSTRLARAELEARKPLPLSYRAGLVLSSRGGGATVTMHFNDMAEAEAWFVEITDQHDAGLVDKSPNLQEPLVDKTANLQDRPASLIASREVAADGPVRVTRLHLTEEGRAGLTSKATGPLPGIKET
ncbi:hypothetical protein KDK82_1750 [Delftia sp. K82]|uniref:hypothetical protein n=1 Tax=Delftia sp. K82 TaxID=1472718 RepID=UPI000B66F369|nr:hypothetical protein [Delftia sp. K82]OWG18271.1 hypothetical protein KDK82_1750 [Delftia sp. K82]